MRIKDLFESALDDVYIEDMDLSDALYVLAEMMDDDKLSEKEVEIIEEMFDRLFSEEDDYINIEYNLEETIISDHGDTEDERSATFKKSSMSDRIKNRIYQRRYRKSSTAKMKARKRAQASKRCKGKNRSVQLSAPGSNTFVCKLKDKFRSKLMQRVAKRYK